MKARNVLSLILLVFTSNVFATDQWRVFGPGDPVTVKSQYDSEPFCDWQKNHITYSIASAPSGLRYLIHRSFDTWEAGYLSFGSGSNITIETVSGENNYFGYGPITYNQTTGKITSALIRLNVGTYYWNPVIWTDGYENVSWYNQEWYIDVQNTTTHEIGHNLGIAHHSTGNGEPTMATRAQVPSFNTTLKRRTLETDDWLALDFLYLRPKPPTNLYVSGYEGGMPTINWTASISPNIDHYEVWWRETVGSPPQGWQLLATTSATYYVDSRVTIQTSNPEDTYRYKAKAVDQAGLKSWFSNEDEVNVKESPPWMPKELTEELAAIPEDFALGKNYPNPFNPATSINYDLPENSLVNLRIYDLMGREITSLVNGNVEAGYQNVIWDGNDSDGNPVSSGMYLYRLDAISRESDKEFHQTRKMVLLR